MYSFLTIFFIAIFEKWSLKNFARAEPPSPKIVIDLSANFKKFGINERLETIILNYNFTNHINYQDNLNQFLNKIFFLNIVIHKSILMNYN